MSFGTYARRVGCVSTYLGNGGEAARGHRRLLVACLDEMPEQMRLLGYPTGYHTAFRYFQRLRKLAMLVVSDA